ncbi:MAG: hypothetical protein WKF70_15065, partial [Chitinophagaceae bacterium]
MSEVLTMATDVAVIEQKRTSWGHMGIAIYKSEMELQARAQEAILRISVPATIEEVPQHETLLKELKSIQTAIEADRKKITSKFDDLFKRLMQPEKSLTEPLKGLNDEIIKVKKAHELEQQKSQAKMDELKRAKEKVINYVANVNGDYLTKISSTINEMYGYALGAGNISPEVLAEYIKKLESRLSIFDFQPKKPFIAALNADQESVDAVVKANFNPTPADEYIEFFKAQIEERFSDYDVAYQNKQTAIDLANKQEQDRLNDIQQQKNNAAIAAKLDTISTEIVTGPVVKALKQSYEIDMPETLESALSIMSAFVANVNLCLPKLKVNKWFAFTPAQAGI